MNRLSSRGLGSALGWCLAIGCSTAVSATAAADDLIALATYALNGAGPVVVEIPGVQNAQGNWWFNKTVSSGPVKFIWNFTADLDPAGNVSINGTHTVENNQGVSIQVATTFDAPLCPSIGGDTNIGGIVSVKLTTNADGGMISCGGADPFFVAAMSDGAAAQPFYYCPFQMGKTGSGTNTTTINFGLPIPAAPGPDSLGTMGCGTNFTMTAGDKVTFTLLYAANGEAGTVVDSCPGDVTGDGVVDKDDLIEVLSWFGVETGCGDAVDTNGDGIVDIYDLTTVISAWGDCPR